MNKERLYIDIGLNLICRQFEDSEEQIVTEAEENGVGVILTGSSLKSSIKSFEFCKTHEGVYFTAGVHPHDAKTFENSTRKKLLSLLLEKKCVAVGECGLDYDRMYSPKDEQLSAFECQLELAREVDKPLFLHERSAVSDFYSLIREYDFGSRQVVHCFTGDPETADRYLNLGCMIGITGWICDNRRNAELLEAVKLIPDDRLLVETDAPYLLPRLDGIKLKNPNVPSNVKYVVQKLAEVRSQDEEELRIKVLENTKRLFGID